MTIPADDGIPLLYTSVAMMTLAWVVAVARVSVRRWKDLFGLDDWLMCIGLILYTVTCCMCIVCSYYGAGQKRNVLSASDMMQGTKLFFIAEFFYAACTVPIKSSIGVTLLRIADPRRRFTWTIYFIIGATAVTTVIFILAIANICHPITTLWGETTYGTCNMNLNSSVSFLFSAVSITTDWTLAILPAILLWNVQMKSRVKISVALILGLAAFASCATIVRLRYLTLYDDRAEFLYSTGKIGLWSVIEEGIGIIAGSMPALRPLLSLPFFGRSSSPGSDSFPNSTPSQHKRGGGRKQTPTPNVNMNTLAATEVDSSSTRRSGDGDGDSQKHILKETQVTMTAEDNHTPEEWGRRRVLGWKNSDRY